MNENETGGGKAKAAMSEGESGFLRLYDKLEPAQQATVIAEATRLAQEALDGEHNGRRTADMDDEEFDAFKAGLGRKGKRAQSSVVVNV